MKTPLIFSFCLLGFLHPLPAVESAFGNAPLNAAALALRDRVATTHRSGGVTAAIRLLDAEANDFIRKSGATARYDFFAALQDEAQSRIAVTSPSFSG